VVNYDIDEPYVNDEYYNIWRHLEKDLEED